MAEALMLLHPHPPKPLPCPACHILIQFILQKEGNAKGFSVLCVAFADRPARAFVEQVYS